MLTNRFRKEAVFASSVFLCHFVLLITSAINAAVPDLWLSQDIGNPPIVGSADYDTSTGEFTINGCGTFDDAGGTPDQCHYVFQQIDGNFIMTARVLSMTNTDIGAKAGLMVRQSLATESPHLLHCAEPDGDPFKVWRRQTGHTPVKYQADDNLGFPMAFKVWRYNDQVGMFVSKDGIDWEHQCSLTLPNPGQSVYAGMTVASRNPSSLCEAVFDNVHVEPLVLEYKTSHVGNSFPGGTSYIQHWVEAMFVDSGGMIFTSSRWDEGSTECGIYSADGLPHARLDDMHGKGGFAVTASSQYVYVTCKWRPDSNNEVSVRRFHRDGSRAPFSGAIHENYLDIYQASEFPRDEIRGIAVNESLAPQELYVSDHVNERIRIYNAQTMSHIRDLDITRPNSIAVDFTNNTLWVVQAAEGSTPAKVLHYDRFGGSLAGEIQNLEEPRGLAVHPTTGQIWVAEYGVKQQLLIFDQNGSDAGSFGVEGGVYAGTTTGQHGFDSMPGEIHPLKFNGPTGVGFDSSGNLYVSTNGPPVTHDAEGSGSMIRKYNPAGDMLWQRIGLEFIDGADADVTTDGVDVYTKHAHYVLDYSRPTGEEFEYQGFTLDPFRFPDDWRYHEGLTAPEGSAGIEEYYEGARIRNQSAVMIRDFLGGKFMYLEDQGGNGLSIFRAEPDSEMFIPSGRISRVGVNSPDPYIWRDSNGNYTRDYPGEFEIGPYETNGDIWGYWTDRGGDVWTVGQDTGIRRYICQGLDQHGNPIYTYSDRDDWNTPGLFDGWNRDLTRVVYHDDTDTIYLAGYTDDNRRSGSEWGTLGREIVRYDNWYGSQDMVWRIELPYHYEGFGTGETDDNIFAKSMDIVGDYVFVGFFISSHVMVYDRHTGNYVDTLIPGPELGGQFGWLETPRAISAYQRSDGEYIIFAHDETQAKVLMYRYQPGSMRPASDPGNVSNGLDYRYYEGSWSTLPNYEWMSPLGLGSVDNFDLTPRLRNDDFGFRFTGLIQVPADGTYTFYLDSSDGSQLFIGDRLVVDNDGLHDTQERSGSIDLAAGMHAIKVNYFYRSDTILLQVSYEGPGISKMLVPDQVLYHYYAAPSPPSAPTGLFTSALGYEIIEMSWQDNSNDELGFKLERKQEPAGPFELIVTLGADDTYHVDSGLQPQTTYTYRIYAYNGIGDSGYSNESSSTTGSLSGPQAPSGLYTSALGYEIIEMSWQDNSDDEIGFKLERRQEPSGSFQEIVVLDANDNYHKDTGLAALTTYTYRVRAYNAVGDSSYSNESSSTTGPPPGPTSPDNLQAVAGDSEVQLTWDCVEGIDPPALYYTIYRATTQGGPYSVVAVAFGGCNITDRNVYSGTTYYYVLKTVDSGGVESDAFSSEVQATPSIPELPPMMVTQESGDSPVPQPIAETNAVDDVSEENGGVITDVFTEIDDGSGEILYTGDWQIRHAPTLAGGSTHQSNVSGDYAELSFVGSGIDIIGRKLRSGGEADVYVDGRFMQTISFHANSPGPAQDRIWSVTGLDHEMHVITLVNRTGQINIDMFYIK